MLGGDAHPAPLVDRIYRARCVRLGNVAIEQLELEILLAGFLEQLLGLLARSVDVLREARQLDELGLWQGHRVAWPHDAADILENGDLGQGLRAAPAVDGQ